MYFLVILWIIASGALSFVGLKATIWAFHQSKSNKKILIHTSILGLVTLISMFIFFYEAYLITAYNIIPKIKYIIWGSY